MKKILVIWDIILDIFSYWDVKRLNPESPAPLLNITDKEYKLWWASNVAANIASLNHQVHMIGIIGSDIYAKIIQDKCDQQNIKLYSIYSDCSTITKQRFIENTYRQQLLRVDSEEEYNQNGKFNTKIIKYIGQIAPDLIVISDYNKWIINSELIWLIKEYSQQFWVKILADIKPPHIDFFKDIYLLKPNFKEFCEIIGQQIPNDETQIIKQWIELVKKLNVNLIITRWKSGAILIKTDLSYISVSTEAQQVFDVTWAWDTFIATIAWALSLWYDLETAIVYSNKAAWIVIGKVGTVTITETELNVCI